MSTKIEWTDSTWNPVRGCARVSPGCENCYAEKMALRLEGMGHYEGIAEESASGEARWTRNVKTVPEKLADPLRWRKPRRVFVNSMSDLFHPDVPEAFIDKVFAVMALADRHIFQVLTKRPKRMAEYMGGERWQRVLDASFHLERDGLVEPFLRDGSGDWWPPENVWLGTSVEDQTRADERIPHLLRTPAAVRFLSCEPLLGPVQLGSNWHDWLEGWDTEVEHAPGCNGSCRHCPVPVQVETERVSWVIVGGESGPGARPMELEWAREIVVQCRQAGVPVFVKQLGANPQVNGHPLRLEGAKGGNPEEWPEGLRVREFPDEAPVST